MTDKQNTKNKEIDEKDIEKEKGIDPKDAEISHLNEMINSLTAALQDEGRKLQKELLEKDKITVTLYRMAEQVIEYSKQINNIAVIMANFGNIILTKKLSPSQYQIYLDIMEKQKQLQAKQQAIEESFTIPAGENTPQDGA